MLYKSLRLHMEADRIEEILGFSEGEAGLFLQEQIAPLVRRLVARRINFAQVVSEIERVSPDLQHYTLALWCFQPMLRRAHRELNYQTKYN